MVAALAAWLESWMISMCVQTAGGWVGGWVVCQQNAPVGPTAAGGDMTSPHRPFVFDLPPLLPLRAMAFLQADTAEPLMSFSSCCRTPWRQMPWQEVCCSLHLTLCC